MRITHANKDDVHYIGRAWVKGGYNLEESMWHNPYFIKKDATPQEREACRFARELGQRVIGALGTADVIARHASDAGASRNRVTVTCWWSSCAITGHPR